MNIDELLSTTPGKALVKSYHAEQAQKRADLFTEIDTLKQKRDADLPALNSVLDEAITACTEAQSKLESAKVRERIANSKLQQAKASYSSHVARINKELMKSAPPEIDTFCESLKQEAQHLRSNAITTPFNAAYTESVNVRATAIRDVTDKANKLKLESVGDISTELQRLYDSLPVVKKTH